MKRFTAEQWAGWNPTEQQKAILDMLAAVMIRQGTAFTYAGLRKMCEGLGDADPDNPLNLYRVFAKKEIVQ
jgi:hypothetical protein